MTAPILAIDGQQFEAWTRATVRKSLDEFAHQWSVTYVDRWAPEGDPWGILPGQVADFLVGDDVVTSGHVTRTSWQSSATNYTVQAEGRSATADLVDCAPFADLSSDQIRDKTLGAIVQTVCKPFGITVLDESGETTPLRRFQADLGESAFDLIDRLCRSRRVLPMTTPEGWLRLTRSDNFTRSVDMPDDLPVTRSLEYTEADRYSHLFVYGQHPAEEKFRGDRIIDRAGRATDRAVDRHRPLVIISDHPAAQAELDKQADWEMSVRIGRSQTVRYRVGGVLAPDKAPWEPGTVCRLADAVLRVHDTLVVKGVSHTWDETGVWTDLELTRPEAYSSEPVPERKAGGQW